MATDHIKSLEIYYPDINLVEIIDKINELVVVVNEMKDHINKAGE